MKLKIDAWVLSCRAFSRRIEYRSLEELFAKFGVEEIELDYLATERNSPLREFLAEILGGTPAPGCEISRQAFHARAKTLQEPKEMING
jgi:predicted enzyme involved in methoxymalonyl-ACP biosynthesis